MADPMADAPGRTRPRPIEETCAIVANRRLSGALWDMRISAPSMAPLLLPGQFVHMRVPGMDARILRRPFSVYEADAEAGTLGILYQVVGKGSAHMATLDPAGAGPVSLMGPLGNSWWLPAGTRRVLLVAGGVGAAPLAMFAAGLVRAGVPVDVCMGARDAASLVMREYYRDRIGVDPICATDDGSFGHAGFVTEPAGELLAGGAYDLVCCCGPEPVMRITAGLAARAQVPCEVSLERRMACGVGACLSCVVDTVDGRRRSCVDGPVFDARKVVW